MSSPAPSPEASLDVLAVGIRSGLSDGWPDADLVRLVADAIHESALVESVDAQWDYLAREPRLTGDTGWDAALAGLAVHLARMAAFDRTPPWTRHADRYSPTFRWIGLAPDSEMKAYVFQRTPIYFKSRGVMIDVANLVSV